MILLSRTRPRQEIADLIVGCDEATIEACKALMAESKAKKASAPMDVDLAGVKATPADPPVASTAHTLTTGRTATADAAVVPPVVPGVDANKPAVAICGACTSGARGSCICGACNSGACGSCIRGNGAGGTCGACDAHSGQCTCTCSTCPNIRS